MIFNEHKPIYLQICDRLSEKILNEEWQSESRIPSVRELAAELGVNPNTVMRSYEYMQNKDIIYNKRGIGYYVATCAKDLILYAQREYFINEELPTIFRKIELLGISFEELTKLYNQQTLLK